MADLERITTAYSNSLEQLAEDLQETLQPSPDDQRHMELIHELLDSLVRGYGSFYLNRESFLETNTSVMYAAERQHDPGSGGSEILDVSLRSLVDGRCLTIAQARYLGNSLRAKRSLIVTGDSATGKSTLLNALVKLIPVDQRIVAIEQDDHLPILRERSFTVHLSEQQQTVGSTQALNKASGMKPTWILVGELKTKDGPGFLGSLDAEISGLTTITTPDPEITLENWKDMDEAAAERLEHLSPIFTHMERNPSGMPLVKSIAEVSTRRGSLALTKPEDLDERHA